MTTDANETTPTATKGVAVKDTGKTGDTLERYKVRLSHPGDRKRVVFSSVSERRARRFIQNRYPRGEEAYLEKPDGTFESYQHERSGPRGEDVDQWGEFDPESYKPPEEAAPPGDTVWQDVEA